MHAYQETIAFVLACWHSCFGLLVFHSKLEKKMDCIIILISVSQKWTLLKMNFVEYICY